MRVLLPKKGIALELNVLDEDVIEENLTKILHSFEIISDPFL